ncbi:hypothetical protein ACFL47_10525, partial [Candidatus Latescibacterota bacterium]
MDISLPIMLVQIVNFIMIILWMTGLILIVIEFFREFRGKKYDADAQETEKFLAWKGKRYHRIKRGLIILISGMSIQVVLTTV